MALVDAEDLAGLCESVLRAAGSSRENAQRVAASLVSADAAGVSSHGVCYLPRYVGAIRAGHLVPDGTPRLLHPQAGASLVSGGWTFGQVGGHFAMAAAIASARSASTGLVGLVEAHHLGRLGEYAEMAAQENMVSLIFASGYAEDAPVAAPYGGRRPALHTNPLAIGVPQGDGAPIVVDFATTATTGFQVRKAAAAGTQLSPGTIIDAMGRPSTDPKALDEGGSHLPFGGHKGYALMVAVEMLGHVLVGADGFRKSEHVGSTFRTQGATFITIRADVFTGRDTFASRARAVIDRIHAVPPAAGFERVLVPGEIEEANRERSSREGVSLSKETWAAVIRVARALGVEYQAFAPCLEDEP